MEVTTDWWIWSQSLLMLNISAKCRHLSPTKTKEFVNPLSNLSSLDGVSLPSAISKAASKKEHTETVKAEPDVAQAIGSCCSEINIRT